MKRSLVLPFLISGAVSVFVPEAHSFQILSAVTRACHEKITLAAVNEGDSEFIGNGNPAATALLQKFIDRVNQLGVPNDDATHALLKEMTNRFGWHGMEDAKRFVLMSFVAGARSPDTQGFSVIDINHIRGNHLTNEAQSTHLLRKRENDGADGNLSAIEQTRDQIDIQLGEVLQSWANSNALIRGERWTFAFYGEQIAQVFGPAYDLGAIAHAVEDSYSHAIRADDMKIVAIANYLEQILDQRKEDRDGPAHSERMDECNPQDAFDSMRIQEARKQVALLFNALDAEMSTNGTDISGANTVLDATFEYQPGCDRSNSYCGTSWYEKAKENPSEPYRVGVNCGVVKSIDKNKDRTLAPLVALFMLLPFVLIVWVRERKVAARRRRD